jgi:NADPH-dependent 2,4-dienoyl-CoA reductase/sulfur reductase-like enzyme/CxxC motif-containing protein
MKSLHADVAVIGGGPAGMSAALAASREGARVLVIERNLFLGGILNQCIHDGFGLFRFGKLLSGPEYAGVFAKEIRVDKNITALLGATVTRVNLQREVYGVSREGRFCCQAGAVVFATGCRERTRGAIAIPGTRPAGIYTAGVVQQLINVSNVAVGKRALILGSGDIGLIMARRLTLSGVDVVCVLEKLPYCSGLPRNVYQCLEDYGIPLRLSRTVTEVRGGKRLEGVVASSVDSQGIPIPGSEYEIPCDTLILSVGLIPENEIAFQMGVTLLPDTNGVVVDNRMETSIPGVFACGNAVYVNDLVDNVSDEGERAGKWAAARALGRIPAEPVRVQVQNGAGVRSVTPQSACPGSGLPGDPCRGGMTKNMVCFICPKSCLLSVQEIDDEILVKNNRCDRGAEFAVKELGDPERTLTSTMRVNNGALPLVSIRSETPVKKTELKDLVRCFDGMTVDAPVSSGDVLFSAIGKNGVNIIATRSVEEKVLICRQ